MHRVPTYLFLALCLSGCTTPKATSAQQPEAAQDAPASTNEASAAAASEPAASPPPEGADGWRSFGAEFTVNEVVAASQLLASPADYAGKTLVMEGTVADVCQKAGCWLVVTEGTNTIRIRTKDHGFTVDKDCSGDTARIHGLVVSKDITPEEAAHFASESQKPEIAPESGKAEKLYEIEATGIKLKKS